MGLKGELESKLLREEGIAKVASRESHNYVSRLFFLESILSLNKHSSYIYTSFIAIWLISLNFIKNFDKDLTLSLKVSIRIGITLRLKK